MSGGALLILDEVQTGCGTPAGSSPASTRRDTRYAHDGQVDGRGAAHGRLPARAARRDAGRVIARQPFGGNPLACAAALATLDVIETEDLPGRAARLGAHAMERLQAVRSPLVRQVRGLGLLIGIELKIKVTPVLQRLQARGVLALPAGASVLRLLPPLVISQDDLDQAIEAIVGVLDDLEQKPS